MPVSGRLGRRTVPGHLAFTEESQEPPPGEAPLAANFSSVRRRDFVSKLLLSRPRAGGSDMGSMIDTTQDRDSRTSRPGSTLTESSPHSTPGL